MAFPIWLTQLLISSVITFVGYLLMPKPKVEQPDETKEMEGPTAEAGKPVAVIFGEEEIEDYNFLWWGDKRTQSGTVSGGKK